MSRAALGTRMAARTSKVEKVAAAPGKPQTNQAPVSRPVSSTPVAPALQPTDVVNLNHRLVQTAILKALAERGFHWA